MSEEKKKRRSFLKCAIAAIICGVVAGGGGYLSGVVVAPPASTVTKTETVTKTALGPTITRTETRTITETELPKLEEIKKIKSIIKTEVEDAIVYHREESSWIEGDFLEILEDKDEFSSNLIERFTSTTLTYGKEVVNPRVEFNPDRNSTILTGEVHGAISKTGNRYYATFEWLLKPMGLDFINDNFKETVQGLSWEGMIDGVPTEINCEFPYTGSPYKAWAHPTGHCHAHVWWEL